MHHVLSYHGEEVRDLFKVNMSGYRLYSFELLIGIPLSRCPPLRDHAVLCCVSPVGCTSLSDSKYEYKYYVILCVPCASHRGA